MHFEELILQAENNLGYLNYKRILPLIHNMMLESWQGEATPSEYWKEELGGFDYMFDASPLIVSKLREHCYHLTGLKSYEYRNHHIHATKLFEKKLNALKEVDKRGIFVSESEELGGFGHRIDGDLVNLDTLKFYETLIAMDKGGILEPLLDTSSHQTVVEVGGGWGGLAYQIKNIGKKLTYVIVDLPPTLLFSSVYLSTVFPDAKIFIYGDGDLDLVLDDIQSYDFIFLPHYIVPQVKIKSLDLAINMISFQEMTTEQVSGYVSWFAECGCEKIYSHNRGRSPHNTQLSDVSELLNEHYMLEEVKVLSVPYTVLRMPSLERKQLQESLPQGTKTIVKHLLWNSLNPVKKKIISPRSSDYKHIVGSIKL